MENDLRNIVKKAMAAFSRLDIVYHDPDVRVAGTELHNALGALEEALGNNGDQLIKHVMDGGVIDDDELFRLFQEIASYIADAANNGSMTDAVRIQLTGTSEFVLEALSSMPKTVEELEEELEPEEEAGPEFVNIKEAELKALKEVVGALVGDVRFILKHVVRRDSLPAAPVRADRLDALARAAGIREPRTGG